MTLCENCKKQIELDQVGIITKELARDHKHKHYNLLIKALGNFQACDIGKKYKVYVAANGQQVVKVENAFQFKNRINKNI